ncbi:MAG: aspartate/glutamate racemase family protein [Melioribacteraceae bacterium]|nr:aspartate/glutamate racemase family protein [Melioribacteraceae bacterium]
MNEKIKIVVTDSGLGGISVLAELENKLRSNMISQNVELIYVNAYPGEGYGYNNMESEDRKIEVFNDFLESVQKKFNPNLILIACNTLSVIYNKTEFSKTSLITVIGIIEIGVSLVQNKISSDEDIILLLGTETTISSNAHKNALISKGISETQIIMQACKNLETLIQKNAEGNETESLIKKYLSIALSKLELNDSKIICGLFCTHYGYSKSLFEKNLLSYSSNIKIVNPNDEMANRVFKIFNTAGIKKQNVTVTVYSRCKIENEDIKSIGSLIKTKSDAVFSSLNNYQIKKDLFTIFN